VKVLVAIPYTPWPVRKGTDRLILNLISGLAGNHRTILATMTEEPWELDRLHELESTGAKIEAILAPHRRGITGKVWHKARNLALSVFKGIPTKVSYSAPQVYLEFLGMLARRENVDIVLASYWYLYRLPEYIDASKLVLITHDLDFIVNSRRRRFISNPFSKLKLAIDAGRLERIEKKAYKDFKAILTVTPLDAEVLKRYPFVRGKLIEPLPLALDLGEFDPSLYRRDRNRVLFLGTFYSDFNRDAFYFFNNEVFPSILKEVPSAKVDVVGFGVDERMKREAHESVRFVGGVDDIRPYLGECTVMVLPLRFCGGVRIRMLEAAAMGTPVVSTSIGVEGLGLEAGVHFIRGDSAKEMADGVVSLLKDPDAVRRLSESVRAWAEKNISMSDYPERLSRLLQNLVEI